MGGVVGSVTGRRQPGQPGIGKGLTKSATSPLMRVNVPSSPDLAAVMASSMHRATNGMCSSVSPRVVTEEVPSRMPDGSNGLRVS